MRYYVAVAALLCLSLPAKAGQHCDGNPSVLPDSPILCSKLASFSGICGTPNYPGPDWGDVVVYLVPWERRPIRIVAASADAIIFSRGEATFGAIFVGDSFNSDPVTPLRYGVGMPSGSENRVYVNLHTEQSFPQGTGMLLPAKFDGQTEGSHVDVHLSCGTIGANYQGNLIVWYVFDAP